MPLNEFRCLLEINSELLLDEYQEAQEIATSEFEKHTPIRIAVEILAGEKPHTPQLKQEYIYPIIGVDDSTIWSLTLFLGLMQYVDEVDTEIMNQLERLVLEL